MIQSLFPPYLQLARFAGNLAACHRAGLEIGRSLDNSGRALTRANYRHAVDSAVMKVRQGDTLASALASKEARWPSFFIPLLDAGEQSGQLDQALRYLENHCRMLAGPALALRNAWLYPLCICLAGSAINFILHWVFDSWGAALGALVGSFKAYGILAIAVVPFVAPQFKPIVDPVKLAIPMVGAVERELGLNRFFCALAMLYSAAGQRVECMIRFAAQTVPNLAVRADLLQTAGEIERSETITEAFQVPRHLTDEQKGTIAAGDLSGTLEQSFDRIADATGESLESRLELFQMFSVRFTMYAVIGSIVATMLSLVGTQLSR